MMRSGFIFDRVDCLYYSCNKASVNRGGTIIKSPDQTDNKRATINLKKQ